MLADCCQAFTARDLERAIAILRSDAEIDRLRNLIFIRHTEDHAREGQKDSFHVLAMAQAWNGPAATPRTPLRRLCI